MTHKNSYKGLAGVRACWVANFSWGVLAPQLEANFIREFENKAKEVGKFYRR